MTSSLANARILLTGGAGFIGSHVAEALLRAGANLFLVDSLNDFYSRQWKQANLNDISRAGEYQFTQAAIEDGPAMRGVFERSRPQIVVHLAAYAGVRPSIERPMLYEQANVAGTLNLLELCREHRVPRFLFGSSSSVYGASSKVPFSEDQVEMRPISPYAATKLAGELLTYTYAHLHGLTAVCLRFFTVYGPRQRPDLAIHKFTALIEAGLPVPIFGDGSTGRDYTYVDDIVQGVLASLTYDPPLAHHARFDVFNLGNSHPITLREMVDTLEQVTGRRVVREFLPLQPGDVPITWADISKAQRLLGYQPSTSFREGIERFVAWYRNASCAQKLVPARSQAAHV